MRVGAHSFPYCQGVKKKNLLSECSFLVFQKQVSEFKIFSRCCRQGTKKRIYFQSAHFFFFVNRLVSSGFFQGAPKKTTFLEPTGKTSSTRPAFCFSLTPSSKGEVDLKIDKTFSKITFLQFPTSTKMIQQPQHFDMLQKLSM